MGTETKREEWFRLPNGSVTTDVKKWGKMWTELGDLAVSYFPGSRVYGMDPGLSFISPDKVYFELPLSAIKSLLGEKFKPFE